MIEKAELMIMQKAESGILFCPAIFYQQKNYKTNKSFSSVFFKLMLKYLESSFCDERENKN